MIYFDMNKLKKILVINATAAETSGALTILKQVLDAIPDNNGWEYIVFISPNISLDSDKSNIHLFPIAGVKSFVNRFMWDLCGVKKWLKKNGIIPTATLSLQNTNFNTGYKIPNYIYLHQSIPFFNYKWSPFKREERILWFYKNIYPFFIKLLINKRTKFFVQLEYIKAGLSKKFKIALDNIYIIKPYFTPPRNIEFNNIELDMNKINLFYPAASLFYKNHAILLNALNLSEKRDNFAVYFTFNADANIDYGSSDIKFLGQISYEMVAELYSKVDALVFPSYMESYGLPLLEAASFGIPIIASDLPYAREVLKDYDGASFIKYNDAKQWENAINMLQRGKKYKQIELDNESSWDKMFQIINKI